MIVPSFYFFPFTISYLGDGLSRNFRRRMCGARITYFTALGCLLSLFPWHEKCSFYIFTSFPSGFYISILWHLLQSYLTLLSPLPEEFLPWSVCSIIRSFSYSQDVFWMFLRALSTQATSAQLLLQPLSTHLQMGVCKALPRLNYSFTRRWMPSCWSEHLLLISGSWFLGHSEVPSIPAPFAPIHLCFLVALEVVDDLA